MKRGTDLLYKHAQEALLLHAPPRRPRLGPALKKKICNKTELESYWPKEMKPTWDQSASSTIRTIAFLQARQLMQSQLEAFTK